MKQRDNQLIKEQLIVWTQRFVMGWSDLIRTILNRIHISLISTYVYKRIIIVDMEIDEEPKLNGKGLVFKEYSSLELATRDKFIKGIREAGYDAKDIEWVATEKIHGSNFSIHYNGQSVRYGRRTDFLTKDIPVPCEHPGDYFLQSFYDARRIVGQFHNKLNDVYKTIMQFDPKMIKFSIYGEYFGGNWPLEHPNAIKGGPKQVQKGVCYTPEHQFMVFDIFIVTEHTAYWADVYDIPKLLKDNIKSVPVYMKGTFDEVFNVNTEIDSTIPEILGLPKLQKNLIEGMVIRPNKCLRNTNNDRVIIKKKNKEFLETVSKPNENKTKGKGEKQIDPEIALFLDPLLTYLNVNRIDSVVSKFPDLKDRNKLKELVVKDILGDAEKDEFKMPPNEEKHKTVVRQLGLQVMKEVNSYFIKH